MGIVPGSGRTTRPNRDWQQHKTILPAGWRDREPIPEAMGTSEGMKTLLRGERKTIQMPPFSCLCRSLLSTTQHVSLWLGIRGGLPRSALRSERAEQGYWRNWSACLPGKVFPLCKWAGRSSLRSWGLKKIVFIKCGRLAVAPQESAHPSFPWEQWHLR